LLQTSDQAGYVYGRGAGLASGQVPNRTKVTVFLTILAILIFLILLPPLHQDQSYHSFADQRTLFGIPNFWDVVSNLPFAVVGLIGLLRFRDFAARVVFLGIFATAFGSAYYHLNPDDARLFWDRLPMTVAFMSIFAMAIRQRRLVVPLVMVGVASIVWWRLTGNLWPYGLVQFGSMAVLIVIAFHSEPGLWPVIVWYGLSKVTEYFDKQIYSVSPLSGHTLKHLLAGIGAWYVLRWLHRPSPLKVPRQQAAEDGQS
jgi:hypothetical protein